MKTVEEHPEPERLAAALERSFEAEPLQAAKLGAQHRDRVTDPVGAGAQTRGQLAARVGERQVAERAHDALRVGAAVSRSTRETRGITDRRSRDRARS